MPWIGLFGLALLLGAPPLAALSPAGCVEPGLDTSRIAVAGGSITEIIYALDMGESLVAVDRTSNYPPAATRLPSLGYVRAVSAEGLLALNPTVVLGEHDIGPVEVVAQIRQAGLPVVVVPEVHTVDGIFAKVACVAAAIGAPAAALRSLHQRLQEQRQRLPAAPAAGPVKAAILLSLEDGVPTGGGVETSAHGVLTMAGAENVFAAFKGWKPVSLEAMAASDPDVLIMPKRGIKAAGGREAVLAHAAVRLTRAGREQRLIGVDGMSLLGFGPRTLDVALQLAAQLQSAGSAE